MDKNAKKSTGLLDHGNSLVGAGSSKVIVGLSNSLRLTLSGDRRINCNDKKTITFESHRYSVTRLHKFVCFSKLDEVEVPFFLYCARIFFTYLICITRISFRGFFESNSGSTFIFRFMLDFYVGLEFELKLNYLGPQTDNLDENIGAIRSL